MWTGVPTFHDAAYIKQRIMRILERALPSARIYIDIADGYSVAEPAIEIGLYEANRYVGVIERIDLLAYFHSNSEDYLRYLARELASRVLAVRCRDSWDAV